MEITFQSSVYAEQSNPAHWGVAAFARCISTEKLYIKLRCRFISVRLDRSRVARRMIWSRFPASRTSRSWKRRHSLLTLSRADCRADQLSRSGSKNMCRRVARQICIRNNHRRALRPAQKLVATANTERSTVDDRQRNPEHEPAEAFLRAGSRRSWVLHRPECLHRMQGLRGRLKK